MAALISIGMNKGDAQTIADKLVLTDSWGTFTHGNKLLGDYIARLEAGGTNPLGKPKIASEGPAWAIVDGDNAAGQIGCNFAMRQGNPISKISWDCLRWSKKYQSFWSCWGISGDGSRGKHDWPSNG